MPTLERARAKHNEIVAQLAKAVAAKDKALNVLIRREAKRVECERAVIRSAKRLDKIRAAAVHTTGPTGSVADNLLADVVSKPTPAAKLNDPLPTFARRGMAAQKAVDAEVAKATSVSIEDLHKTPQGKANAKSWDAIPAIKRARKRRTPDDFAADMGKKKSATEGVDGR
jgi:hypothetical protein